MALLKTGDLIIGAGDGTLCVIKGYDHKQPFQRTKYDQEFTSSLLLDK